MVAVFGSGMFSKGLSEAWEVIRHIYRRNTEETQHGVYVCVWGVHLNVLLYILSTYICNNNKEKCHDFERGTWRGWIEERVEMIIFCF